MRLKVAERLQSDRHGCAKISDEFEKLRFIDPRLMTIGGEKYDADHDLQSSEYERENILENGSYKRLKKNTKDGD